MIRRKGPEVPDGLMKRCNKCGKGVFTDEVIGNDYICPKCGGYLRVPADKRTRMIADADSFEEWDKGLTSPNPLHMKAYPGKIQELQEKTGLDEAVVSGSCTIGGIEAVLMVMDGRFLMGSLGMVCGEKITRGIERATKRRLPVIIFCCSGGARMQEGTSALMQMAKTSAALKRHSDAGLLYISVLTDPTTGGVTASFASLGDIILAEPDALIGFAGPRVIEQTIGKKLPKGFQRAESLLSHGFVDRIVKRQEMRWELCRLLRLHETCGEVKPDNPAEADISGQTQPDNQAEAGISGQMQESKIDENASIQTCETGMSENKTAWDRVQASRASDRPVGMDYVEAVFDDFVELHGDREFGDDSAICGGIAHFQGKPVTVIVQMKGRGTKEHISHNFGMPMPEGYRKALRLMKQAEKFHRPVICIVDTPGAYCGVEAEERGQGQAIAENLFQMSALETPILSILVGEGGSGGALALAVADEVWMLENAVYSILSPEGYASILWKDAKLAEKAARSMKLTSCDLKEAGIIEHIFAEPDRYNLETIHAVTEPVKRRIKRFLDEKKEQNMEELLEERYRRFRRM